MPLKRFLRKRLSSISAAKAAAVIDRMPKSVDADTQVGDIQSKHLNQLLQTFRETGPPGG